MKRPPNPKLIGERAECAYMWQALERGLIVSKPFGDSASYDVIVEPVSGRCRGTLIKVQVRSVFRKNGRGYKVDARRGFHRRPLTPADADFLAAYIAPERAWYIIPVRAFSPANHLSLYPQNPTSTGKWEPFREAWHLLLACGSPARSIDR